jgi:hypothetical protein
LGDYLQWHESIVYLQQRGISGETQDRKSSSQDAAGDAMYVCDGVLAALATCKAVPHI